MELLNFLNLTCHKSFHIFLSVLVIIFIYPIFFIVVGICWIYRIFVQYIVQKDPKYGKLLTDIDGVYCGENPYSKPLVVLIPYFLLTDRLDIPQVLDGLKTKALEPGYFPELKQKIVKKYGYHFWCTVENFKVEDHVTYLQPECPNMPVTRAELRDLVTNKLGQVPFDPTRSPWQLMVATNYIDETNPDMKSAVILKVNHCLMDGYAISQFFRRFSSKPCKTVSDSLQQEYRDKDINKNWYLEFYKIVWLLITGPYHALDMFVLSNDNHSFVKNSCDPFSEGAFKSQCSPIVPISRLKIIKNRHNVSLTALITTIFAQATYNSMKKVSRHANFSKRIHGFLSFPLPGHPGTLTNHWSLVRIPVQVYENDPVKTLKFVENEFQNLKSSTKPLVFFYAMKLCSIFPTYFHYVVECITPSVFILTNFPGPMEPADLFGCRGTQISLGGKPCRGTGIEKFNHLKN